MLYDRVLKDDIEVYINYRVSALNSSVENSCIYFNGTANLFTSFSSYSKSLSDCVSSLKALTGVNDYYTLSFIFNVYKSYVRCASDRLLHCVDTFSDLFTLKFVTTFISDSCDVYENYKHSLRCRDIVPLTACFQHSNTAMRIFQSLDKLCDIYTYFLEDIQLLREKDFQKAESLREMLRTYNYPTDLC